MASFNDTFERKEIKHVISAQQHEALKKALEGRMAIDAYGRSTITSIYYDTPNYDVIERSLDKPLYKEKLRVRVYGTPEDASTHPAYVEVKKKYKGIVYKRRVRMTMAAVQAYFQGATYEQASMTYPLPDPAEAAAALSPRSMQIAREVDRFCEFHAPLSPSIGISVQRSAYAPVEGAVKDFATENLRITIDEDICYRDLRVEGGEYTPLMRPGYCVLEVKAMGAMPSWLTDFFSEQHIYPKSFSKCGEAYKTIKATDQASMVRVAGRVAHRRGDASRTPGHAAPRQTANRRETAGANKKPTRRSVPRRVAASQAAR